MSVSAKKLIMNLLLASKSGLLTTAEAVNACELFEISSTNARVTLGRLVSAGLIEPGSRGEYYLSDQGKVLAQTVARWRTAEDDLKPWNGDWIVAVTSALPKADRTAWRVRDRAMSMVGLQELDSGLMVRPANFVAGIDAFRSKLGKLGIGNEVPVFLVSQIDAERDQRARQLWQGHALVAGYKSERARMNQWLEKMPRLSLEERARDTFIIGDAAIHRIVFDPHLPAPLIDEAERQAFRRELIAFDDAGRSVWKEFFQR